MDKRIAVFVFLFVSVAVIFLIMLISYKPNIVFANNSLQTTHIDNVFVDVNGDGNLDLIVSGEVVLNKGDKNFTKQPEK